MSEKNWIFTSFFSMNFHIFIIFGYDAFSSFTRYFRLKNVLKLIFPWLSYWMRDRMTMSFYLVVSCQFLVIWDFFVRNDISWTSLFHSHIPVMWRCWGALEFHLYILIGFEWWTLECPFNFTLEDFHYSLFHYSARNVSDANVS